MKVIHILCHSIKMRDDYIYPSFQSLTAQNIKKYDKNYYIQECWFAINNIKKEKVVKKNGIVYRFFPTMTVSVLLESFFGLIFSPLLLNALKKEVKKDKVIFHIQGERGLLVWKIIEKVKGNPVVIQFHGYRGIWFLRPIEKFIIERGEKYFFKYVNHFFVHFKSRIDYLIKNCAISKEKISFQNLGVDYDLFFPTNKNLVRKELNLPLDKNIILHIGVFNKTKGLEKILNVQSRIKNNLNTYLMVIGGSKKDPLYNLCKEKADLVLERIPHEELPKYISASDVYCMICPVDKRKYGGIGIASMEALACNVPVLNSNIDDAPKEIKEKIGFKVENELDLENKIKYILKNKNKFKNLRKLSEPYFSWKVISNNIIKVYREIR